MTEIEKLRKRVDELEKAGDVCPHCGRCKHCGRGEPQVVPMPYPVYPTYPQPQIPVSPWTSPTIIWCRDDSQTSAQLGGTFS